MLKHSRFKLSLMFIATYIVAVCMCKNLVGFTLTVLLEPIAIWISVSTLMWNLPRAIIKASNDNCFRMDGSRSDRRTALERNAMTHARWNLYFVLVAMLLANNWLYLVVDSFWSLENLDFENVSERRIAAVVVLCLLWLTTCFMTVHRFYDTALRELNLGIASRAKHHLALDIQLAQREFEREQQSFESERMGSIDS